MVIGNVLIALLHWFQANFTFEKTLFFGVIGTLPAIFWLIFFLVEEKRKKREPRRMISYVFLGGAVSAFLALVLQLIFKAYTVPGNSFNPDLLVTISDNSALQLLIFAFMEEGLKFLLVYLVAHKSKFFDEPVDGMLDMVTGAMGFAAFENVLFIANAFVSHQDVTPILIFRFIGAILLHGVTSGFIGFYWTKRKLALGIVIATLLHFVFNMVVLYPAELAVKACESLHYISIPSNCAYFYDNSEFISGLGVVIAPFLLVLASFFLFRDFDIIEKQENN